jgi:hypothetical protein
MRLVIELGRILAGATLVVITCMSLGRLLLIPVQNSLDAIERAALSFVLGAGLMSLIVFVLGVMGFVGPRTYLGLGAVTVVAAIFMRDRSAPSRVSQRSVPLTRSWYLVWAGVLFLFGGLYLVNAFAPEVSPDGSSYHLGLVSLYARANRIGPVPTNFYAGLSQGLEMLFLVAFVIGKHSAAALVHLVFLASLLGLVVSFGRRIGVLGLAFAAAILVAVSPVVGIDAISAYNDVALACIGFSCFFLLTLWEEMPTPWVAYLAGCMAGFCYGVKYSGVGAFALGPLLILLARKPVIDRSKAFAIGFFMLGAISIAIVWPIRNAIWYGNPLAPLYNSVFANGFVHISLEQQYREAMAHYGSLSSRWEIPLEITVLGFRLQGLLGPVFLLSPVALFSLRLKQGRRLLIAALLFSFPFSQNLGTRFLIPALAFIALAMMCSGIHRRIIYGVVLIHVFLSLPMITQFYCNPYAWRIRQLPWRAALHIDKKHDFERESISEWDAIAFLNLKTPPTTRVLGLSAFAYSYVEREVAVADATAIGENLRDVLWTAHNLALEPNKLVSFAVAPKITQVVRVHFDGPDAKAGWGINELHIYGPNGEITRNSKWLLSASPNANEVAYAFDNNPVTRWATWEAARKGMYVEVDLGRGEAVNEITILTNAESSILPIRTLTNSEKTVLSTSSDTSLRRAATAVIASKGFSYLFLRFDDPLASDLHDNAGLWRIAQVYSDPVWIIYRIDR